MAYQKISVVEAVNYIDQGRMFLPEIQRKFVWKPEQIENLFDSLILGYPIGALLFWKTSKAVINSGDSALSLYKFIRDYHERDNHDNEKASLPLLSDFDSYYIVLDGQQRLSSLYIALMGSLSMKLPRNWWKFDGNFPKKELYMNLSVDLSQKISDDDAAKRFRYLTQEEFEKEPSKWFKVKDVFRHNNEYSLITFANETYHSERAGQNILRLFKVLSSKENGPLSFYEIEEADYDDVLNIFVRINSSGTPLSKTDLLFSTIVSSWNGGREEIESLIGTLNGSDGKFSFDTDFVMRACLTLTDGPINLKINSFKKTNVERIRNNWQGIKNALVQTSDFLRKVGFAGETIASYNALIPIAYYLYKGGELNDANIKGFKLYFVIAQIKNLFGFAANSALSETRKALQAIPNCKKTPFSLNLFDDVRLSGGLDFKVGKETIDRCFDYDKGSYTFMLLALLYPEVKTDAMAFHQDHVHPYAAFDNKRIKKLDLDKETVERWQKMRNKLPNLQLLQGYKNEAKNDTPLSEWIAESPDHKVKYIPEGMSADLKDFEKFYAAREKLMRKELAALLGCAYAEEN